MQTMKFSLTPELREALKAHAAKEEMSESRVIRVALREHLKKQRKGQS